MNNTLNYDMKISDFLLSSFEPASRKKELIIAIAYGLIFK